LWYIIQHWTVLKIFPLILQTPDNYHPRLPGSQLSQKMSTGEEGSAVLTADVPFKKLFIH